MSQLSRDYLRYTFLIMLSGWGICLLCGVNGITLRSNYLLYLPYLLGGWSPTIASWIALKKHKQVTKVRDWLKQVFDWKHSLLSYSLVILFAVLFILPQCILSGYDQGAPLFAVIFMLPVMLFGGGLEEAGWRYILQPELEKKYPSVVSTCMVGVIWWLWHLPLFYIPDVAQYGQNYFAFGINLFGLTFALACIKRNTNSVFLCVLFHCLANALSGVYLIHDNIIGNVVSALLLIVSAVAISVVQNRKNIFH